MAFQYIKPCNALLFFVGICNIFATLKHPMNINGVDCYEKDGTAYLKLDAVARGLGFTTVAASGNEVVRWNTVYGYLTDLKVVAGSCNGNYRDNCPDFIPENIFYRLAIKLKRKTAKNGGVMLSPKSPHTVPQTLQGPACVT